VVSKVAIQYMISSLHEYVFCMSARKRPCFFTVDFPAKAVAQYVIIPGRAFFVRVQSI
jgi:hypothetical protein